MRLPRLSKRLLSLGLLSGFAAAAGSCGSDYALFKIHVAFSGNEQANDYQDVEHCRLSIADEKGGNVLSGYELTYRQVKYMDGNGQQQTKMAGCSGGVTPKDVDTISYSTSRTSGTLTFTVDALDNNGGVTQHGSATGEIKVFSGSETPVEITLNK